jgi:rare lipoprotein A
MKKLAIIILISAIGLVSCNRKVVPQINLSGNGKLKTETGNASYYADKFNGHPTASGEKYNSTKYTAAHRKLPFGTVVLVTNLSNNKSVKVKINDRGPFVSSRIIDLSKAAANAIGLLAAGVAKVTIQYRN